MTPETLFTIASTLVLPGWILLAVAPRWRGTHLFVHSGALPLVLCAIYAVLVGIHLRPGRGGFGSVAEVAMLFEDPWLLLAGWVHYLAFDLLVGAWEVRDAARAGLPHLVVVPCLALTFLLGPTGFLLYALVRIMLGRTGVASATTS